MGAGSSTGDLFLSEIGYQLIRKGKGGGNGEPIPGIHLVIDGGIAHGGTVRMHAALGKKVFHHFREFIDAGRIHQERLCDGGGRTLPRCRKEHVCGKGALRPAGQERFDGGSGKIRIVKEQQEAERLRGEGGKELNSIERLTPAKEHEPKFRQFIRKVEHRGGFAKPRIARKEQGLRSLAPHEANRMADQRDTDLLLRGKGTIRGALLRQGEKPALFHVEQR